MATIFATDFESYSTGTGSLAGNGWDYEFTEVGDGIVSTPTHGGTRAFKFTGEAQHACVTGTGEISFIVWVYADSSDPLSNGFGMRIGPLASGQYDLSYDGGEDQLLTITSWNYTGSPVVLDTVASAFPTDTWFKFEAKVILSSSNGVADGRVQTLINDVVVSDVDNVIAPSATAKFGLVGIVSTFDDLNADDVADLDPTPDLLDAAIAIGYKASVVGAKRAVIISVTNSAETLTTDNTIKLKASSIILDGTVTGGSASNALLDGSVHSDTTNSPVTKGDLIVGNSTPAWDDLAVGTDGQVLTADSAQTLGVKWATPSGGSNALLDGSTHTDTTNSAVTKGDLIVGNSTPAWDDLAVGSDGQVLTADSAQTLGVKWASPTAGDTIVRKTADETVNNSASLQNDDELVMSVSANGVYWFEIILLCSSPSTASDFKADFTVPSGTTMLYGPVNYQAAAQWDITGTAVNPQVLKTQSSTPTWGGNTGGTTGVWMQGFVFVSSTGGSVQFRWAQNTATVGDSKILANSFIRYRQIN